MYKTLATVNPNKLLYLWNMKSSSSTIRCCDIKCLIMYGQFESKPTGRKAPGIHKCARNLFLYIGLQHTAKIFLKCVRKMNCNSWKILRNERFIFMKLKFCFSEIQKFSSFKWSNLYKNYIALVSFSLTVSAHMLNAHAMHIKIMIP